MAVAHRLLCLVSTLVLVSNCSDTASKQHPEEAVIRQFLQRYFSTWSSQDMEGYGACFAENARVIYVEKDGTLDSEGLTDFLHGQKLSHQTSESAMTEVPLSMQISGDSRVVQAAVLWKLTKGSKEETGTDFFTLRNGSDGWKIATLVFYQN